MKRLLVWVCAAAVVAGAITTYFTVHPVRHFVDGIASTFGPARAREEVTYWCPMHPDIVRKNPGTCPVCNMALVPLEGELKAADSGILDLTDRQVQQAGVRFGMVETRDLLKEIDAYGEITYDERRLARVTSWVAGRIEKLHVNFTGETVSKSDVLAEVYSAPLVVTVEQFREAKRAALELKEGEPLESALRQAEDLVSSTRVLLLRQGLEPEQVREIEEEIDAGRDPLGGGAVPRLPVRAKASGVVIEKKVEEGAYVKEGTQILRIADLATVWLYAEIYENELPFVEEGTHVAITVRSIPGQTFEGHVAFLDPFLQRQTRTVRIRVDIPNEDGKLKPGMFARARIRSELPGVLAVPESAVLHSGTRKVAFVHEGSGRFRPKLVRLGRTWLYPAEPDPARRDALEFALDQYERYHEVLDGLAEGDRVVVAGSFLLGAEAQFQGLLKKMLEDEPEPEAGAATGRCAWDGMEMAVEVMTWSDVGGERLYFCTAEEESAYHREPERSWHAWLRKYRGVIEEVAETYYAVGDSLANDKVDREGFRAIEAAAKLPEVEEHFDAKAREAAERRIEAIQAAAKKGRESEEIVEERRAYGLLSIELVDHVKMYCREKVANGEIYGYHCGMAGRMHQIPTENWLQPGKERRNPYMGRDMYG